MLAGLFKAPTKYAPHVNLPAARARANDVLDNLVDAGFMTEGQVIAARRNPATPVDREREIEPDWYLDWAFEEVKQLAQAGKLGDNRVLTVRTALDSNIQKRAEEVGREQSAPARPQLSRHAGRHRGDGAATAPCAPSSAAATMARASSTARPTRCASRARRSSLTSI